LLPVFDLVVVGGGAAGFFAAINYAMLHKNAKVLIIEKGTQLLGKVKVSGGGRCNVTHACFDAKELTKFYPRGAKELLGAFHRFQPNDTIEWFKQRGVAIKKEADGRMFPVTDNSQTIIDCFLNESQKYGIKINTQEGLKALFPPKEKQYWEVITTNQSLCAKAVMMTTGSSEQIWKLLAAIGHNIELPVPSLFTFNVADKRISNLPGIAVKKAVVKIEGSKLKEQGALLITHWGFSGPAVLKLSAWGARHLHSVDYKFAIAVNWNDNYDFEAALAYFGEQQKYNAKQKIINHSFPEIPSRLWQSIVEHAGITQQNWADISKKQLHALANEISGARFQVNGKSTFKEEFVTCGGVKLSEVDFKTMQSKLYNGLFFSGEVLNIDAVTGGFNFQAAWTEAWIAAQSIPFNAE
jgi:predicted Rossmann fold flavoprotein